ncbi:MAG: DUF4231 domain-containing protein [Alphaproteobacteria bacterium]|nr:DUF4231 domain-containing protein [Alphaproteobacteria bacterium]
MIRIGDKRLSSSLAAPHDSEPDSGYSRLESQIAWYDHKSVAAQRAFKLCKLAEITGAASVAVVANFNGLIASILGVVIVVLQGLQHLNQWQHNWITYRSTCEALRHEKYTFLARSGPYEGADDHAAHKVLAERVEGLISTEHSKWISNQENAVRRAREARSGKGDA